MKRVMAYLLLTVLLGSASLYAYNNGGVKRHNCEGIQQPANV